MGITEIFNRSPRASIAASLGIAACAVAFTVWYVWGLLFPPGPPERFSMAYFYDQNTGELFEGPNSMRGPIETESGPHDGLPAGLRATVFSCGRCADPTQRVVGWLEVPASALAAAGMEVPPAVPGGEGGDLLIKEPGGGRWIPLESAEGLALVRRARQICDEGGTLKYCHPPRRMLSEIAPPFRPYAIRQNAALEEE